MHSDLRVKLVRVAPMPYQRYQYHMPLGIARLTSFLKSKGFHVKQQDLFVTETSNKGLVGRIVSWLMMRAVSKELKNYNGNLDKLTGNLLKNPLFKLYMRRLARRIEYNDFDIVGLSVSTFKEILPAILLAQYLKLKNKTIILGGSYIKISKDSIAENFSSFDYIVYTDGELSLLKILKYLEGKRKNRRVIPSTIYKENGKIVKTPAKKVKLEDIPPPEFDDLLDASDYKLGNRLLIPYTLTMGCKEKCPFCCFKDYDFFFDSSSVDKVVKDLKFLKEKYGSNNFSFISSSNPYNDITFFNRLLDAFTKEKLDIVWESYIRLDYLNEPLAKKMSKSGCRALVAGVESGSDKILKYIKKSNTSKIKKGLGISEKFGLKLAIQLLIGFPYETEEDIKQTIELIKKYKNAVKVILINVFGLSENSDMFLNPNKYGITNIQKSNHYPFLPIFYFDEIEGINYFERKKRICRHLEILITGLKKENIKFIFGNMTNESNVYSILHYSRI